LLSWLVIW